ncbi:MAG: DUF1566 domain-containing protein [Deltaproteobacteria bacterium]|nr:DUF1566 domain-containing protein [Deltaproteobacteria bacterium]
MIDKRTNPPDWSAIVLITLCLLICSAISGYTGELPDSHPSCITCKGSLSPQGRWCDNKNGTVTDMTNGLVWLKDAFWGEKYKFWADTSSGTNAADRAAQVKIGNSASLSDGSQEGAWRLPTLVELEALTSGTEAVRSNRLYWFTGVQSYYYWSSTTSAHSTGYAWVVGMHYGDFGDGNKTTDYYVWPVRGGQ